MRQWHSMPSRAITVSTWVSDWAASASMRAITFFHSSGSLRTPLPEKPLPSVVPPLTPPPLRVDARACELEGGGQPAVARAHDQDIGLARRILRQLVAGLPPFPPPRRGLEVFVEDAVRHESLR